MRCHLAASTWIALTFFGTASAADHKLKVELSDPGLHLQELRPLDRRVYMLTLYGNWQQPPSAVEYYVNFFFPNGGSYSHKVQENDLFRKGEVRCAIQGPQLLRHQVRDGGKFTIAISAKAPADSPTAPEVISNALEVTWPMHRPVSPFRPYTKYSDPPPVDAYPIPGDLLPAPATSKKPPKRD